MPEIPIETVFPKDDPEFDLELEFTGVEYELFHTCPGPDSEDERWTRIKRLARLGAAVEAVMAKVEATETGLRIGCWSSGTYKLESQNGSVRFDGEHYKDWREAFHANAKPT